MVWNIHWHTILFSLCPSGECTVNDFSDKSLNQQFNSWRLKSRLM